LPHVRVSDTRLGITRTARDTPDYVCSTAIDENLPSLKSGYGISLQLSGRSVGHRSLLVTLEGRW